MDNFLEIDYDSDRYSESDSELYFTDDFDDYCEVMIDNNMEMEYENYSDSNQEMMFSRKFIGKRVLNKLSIFKFGNGL